MGTLGIFTARNEKRSDELLKTKETILCSLNGLGRCTLAVTIRNTLCTERRTKPMGSSFFISLHDDQGFVDKTEFKWGHTVTESATGRRFKIVSPARQGGNGVVFRAEEVDASGTPLRKCAVKVLKRLDPIRLDRFNNELRVHQKLEHPRIAKLYGSGKDRFGGESRMLPWAAMDLGGPNLREFQDNYGQLDIQTAIRVSKQTAEAVEHLHSHQIIHRDIKPANFVWADETRDHLFMIDFGLAKYIGEDLSARQLDQFTFEGDFVGPQNWMSPELLAYARDKEHPVGQPSDLFQLGLMIWYFVTNTILAGSPTIRLDPTGGLIHKLVVDLHHQDPSDRIANASDVVARLSEIESKL
jgi:serine/threonine protein kinase